MKHTFLISSLLLILFAVSCNKSSSNNSSSQSFIQFQNSGSVQQFNFTSVTHLPGSNNLMATDQGGDTANFIFNTYPTVSGTYKMVSPSALAAGNNVGFAFYGGYPYSNAVPMDTDNVVANVSVSAGKVNISVGYMEVNTIIYNPGGNNNNLNQLVKDISCYQN